MPYSQLPSMYRRARPSLFAAIALVTAFLGAGLVSGAGPASLTVRPAAAAAPAPLASVPAAPTATSSPTPDSTAFPPGAPTGLTATVTSGSVTLSWAAAHPGCCAVARYEVTYWQAFNDVGWIASVGNVTTATITANIRPATQYRFWVSAVDSGGNRSPASNTVVVVTPVTDSGPDTAPPSAPSSLTLSGASASGAVLTWQPSTDNVGVAGYDVYRFDGLFVSTLLATVTGTTSRVPLAVGGNTFYVRARDAVGNVSIASNTVSLAVDPPPSSPPPNQLSCRVTYTIVSQWTSGFVASILIANTGQTPIDGWTLTFTFNGKQVIISPWGAIYTQSGPAVTLSNASWNSAIPPGGSISVGFQAASSGVNAVPIDFALNGVRCAVG